MQVEAKIKGNVKSLLATLIPAIMYVESTSVVLLFISNEQVNKIYRRLRLLGAHGY